MNFFQVFINFLFGRARISISRMKKEPANNTAYTILSHTDSVH